MKVIKLLTAGLLIIFVSCEREQPDNKDSKDNTINLFSISDDIELGRQLDSSIIANPQEYPILSRSEYQDAYNYLENMRDEILKSDDIAYKETFDWKISIIKDDDMLNAFAAPGGYMYFYTGLMKFLEEDAQLAGVMAHEMAHAARRHGTDMLTVEYSVSIVLSILSGGDMSELTGALLGALKGLGDLSYSRNNEYEADEYSVKYLADTDYDPLGIKGFFIKLESGDASHPPEFLSTHPSPDNRLEAIDEVYEEIGSPVNSITKGNYDNLINSLP